jgi:hypothetical protein
MSEPHLAHIVVFTLHDGTPAKRAELVAACNKYLSRHDGAVYYSAGTLNAELARPVNDRAFDVALHVVFSSKAAHDAYQQHPRHLQFIEENKANWKQVRVFDSDVAAT